jgi:hypothetical protein
MKHSLLALLALVCAPAFAAPFLRADPYPFPPTIAQSNFVFTATAVPGPFSLPCTVVANVPTCDAAPALAVQVPLVTFVMTVKRTAGCDANGANCWTAGEASSIPFERRLLDQAVGPATGLRLEP